MLNWNGGEVKSNKWYILIIFLFGLASETDYTKYGYRGKI